MALYTWLVSVSLFFPTHSKHPFLPFCALCRSFIHLQMVIFIFQVVYSFKTFESSTFEWWWTNLNFFMSGTRMADAISAVTQMSCQNVSTQTYQTVTQVLSGFSVAFFFLFCHLWHFSTSFLFLIRIFSNLLISKTQPFFYCNLTSIKL